MSDPIDPVTLSMEGDSSPRIPLFNREASWLAFNARVLEEAFDARHPLLERVKFLAIFGSNLDEFYMIRVSALQAQRAAGLVEPTADGLTPTEALERVSTRVAELMEGALDCRRRLLGQLAEAGIEVTDWEQLTHAERAHLSTYFHREIFPILTPLAVDPGHPFPHISNLALNLAVVIRDADGEKFARLKVPASLPRLVPVGDPNAVPARFAWLEQIVAEHVGTLFPGFEVESAHPFRVTRDADVEIREAEAEDLLRAVATDIERRHFSFVTRLEVTRGMPEHIRRLLIDGLEMDPRNLVVAGSGDGGVLGLSAFFELVRLDRADLKDPVHVPRVPAALSGQEDIFTAIRRGDILLH
ncbi:MAG: RNA degradosome polyphosphate kinase, partial [Armatimonadota bacterium]